jgi:hypothetical protein
MTGNVKKLSKKLRIIGLLLLLYSFQLRGQNFKQEKRIYALDITGSMWGSGENPNIFDEVKEKLIENINTISDPSTEITILTFGKKVVDRWTYYTEDYSKSELIGLIQNLNFNEANDDQLGTNIELAIEGMLDEIDSSKINYLILMTDGSHNTPNTNLDGVCRAINKICRKKEQAEIVLHPFYNMLTDQANTASLINCLSCFDQIEGPLPVYIFLRPIKDEINIDLYSGNLSSAYTIISNLNQALDEEVKLKLTLEDNRNFSLKVNELVLSKRLGELPIELIPKRSANDIQKELSEITKLQLNIEILSNSNDKGFSYFFKPENLRIRIYNKPVKRVSITLISKG